MLLEGGKVNEPTSANLYERLLREKDARIKVQEDTIADLRETVSAKDDTIAALKALITELKRGTAPLTSVAAE